MNRLFVRVLLTFLTACLILVGVMAAVAVLGFQRSLKEWQQTKTLQLEAVALDILKHTTDMDFVAVPQNTPLFVYDATEQLIFANRDEEGPRRSGSAQRDLVPLEQDGSIVGYYHAGRMQFQSDAANSRFFESISRTIRLGLVLALLISFPFAFFFSRYLTNPAIRLARVLDRLTRGDLSVRIPEKGAVEIALMARSANRLSARLQREQDLRRQWVQDIAHDLRTPISAVKAQFEGMRDGVLEVTPARITKNLKEIARIENLISDLEEMMRLESPEMTLSIEEIEVPVFVAEMKERFNTDLIERQISLECRHQVERLRADPILLERAIANFFTNALRHTDRRGKIVLAVERSGAEISIRVANTGKLIPAEELAKVFDRLYRGEYARSSPGSGLGLTIALRIAELHGGAARIRNWDDKGVIAELLLPQDHWRLFTDHRSGGGS